MSSKYLRSLGASLKTRSRRASLYALAAVMALSVVPVNTVFAQGVPLENYYRESNITFFGEDKLCAANPATPASNPGDISSLIGSDNVERAWNFFIQAGLTPEQAAGVMGNLMVESGMIPDNQQNGSPWPSGGWGIAQWTNPERRDSIAKAVQDAGLPYTNEQTPPDQVVPLLLFQLNYLRNESISRRSITNRAAPNEWEGLRQIQGTGEQIVEDAMVYWEENFERAGVPALGARLTAAIDIYNYYKDRSVPGAPTVVAVSGPGGTTSASGACGGGGVASGAVAGNIAQTAIGLAWPQPFRDKTPDQTTRTSALTPTSAYSEALARVNAGMRADGADCGVFISTVLRASGVDPNFPPISTGAQYDYMNSSPLYTNVGTTTSTDQLQAGDILNIPNHSSPTGVGHTFIYLGQEPQPGGYHTASASLNSRSANLTNDNIVDRRGTYTIFRMTGTAAGAATGEVQL